LLFSQAAKEPKKFLTARAEPLFQWENRNSCELSGEHSKEMNPVARDKAWALARATAAIEYRMLGYTYDEIARELGYASKSGAYNAVKRTLIAKQDATVREFQIESLARLDYMQAQLWPKVHQGEKQAIDINRKIVKQRMQILGHEGKELIAAKPKVPKPVKVSEFDNPDPLHLL